ncbi:MAG: tol-pal system protein YbgF [Arsenophonus sp.]
MNNNFKHLYINFLILVGMVIPVVTIAQSQIVNISSDSTSNLLIQIETAVNSHGQLLYQIQRQLLDAQRDIDILRGQIQENQYQLKQVIKEQKDLNIYLNSFMTNSNKVNVNINNNNKNNSISTIKSTNEKVEYDTAIALAINSKSKQQIIRAISFFQNFIKTYPKSSYQSNAIYWLGQLNYNNGNKNDAAFYFATVVKNYPNSSKVSESFYKIGLLMQESGENEKARAVYQRIIKMYPGSLSAQLAKKKLVSL